MKTIYLAHALTGAPEEFRQRMFALRQLINQISGIKVLEFNWVPGKGPDPTINTYEHDMNNVREADLMVGVLDNPSIGLGMEVKARCLGGGFMRLFHPKGSRVSSIVTDCIKWHRHEFTRSGVNRDSQLLYPIEYEQDQEILSAVVQWIMMVEKAQSWAQSTG